MYILGNLVCLQRRYLFYSFFLSAFTERAIGITSCINDADGQVTKNDSSKRKGKENENTKKKQPLKNKGEKELGDYINHAGRLLLNHGYLKDAINTKNNTYLKNETVTRILNKQWYGTEKINWRTVGQE